MSLLRIFDFGRQFCHRKSLFKQCHSDLYRFQCLKQRQQDTKCCANWPKPSLGPSDPTPTPCYSTIARPHVSKSLLKWKQRKRKSKAQQKKELQSLQKDFTELLTKRALQLIQEDSCHRGNHRVATAHTFSNDSVIRLDNITVQALATESRVFHDMKVCDSLSERLDVHVQNLIDNQRNIDCMKPHNVPSISDYTELRGERTNEIVSSHSNKHNVPSSEDIVLKYLSEKKSDVNSKVLSNFPVQNSNVLHSILDDLFPMSQKYKSSNQLHPDKNDSSACLEGVENSSPAFPQGKSFLRLHSDFQTALSKQRFIKKHWEKHEDYDATDNLDNAKSFIPPTYRRTINENKRQENRDLHELIDKSFIDVCCFTGNELLALRNIEFQSNVNGIGSGDIFNRLIHALAKKQNLEAIKSMFSLFRQRNVSPSFQAYAGCLECVGRMEKPDTFLCERLLVDIEKTGYDLADVANCCSFELDEWDHVVKAIRLVHPDFVPNAPPARAGYDNELLLSLEYEHSNRLENNQYSLEVGRDEIMERFHRQLEMEKAGFVEVQSICVPSERSSDKKMNKLRDDVKENWRKNLCDSFAEKLETHKKKAENNMWMTVYPYLKLFSPEVYADIIFKHIQDLLCEAYSPTQVMCHLHLGHAVNRMYSTQSMVDSGMADKVTRLYDQFAEGYLDKDSVLDNHRALWTDAMASNFDTINMDSSLKKWPKHVIKMVGKFLLDLILYDLKINANLFKPKSPQRLVPAFCTIYRPDVLMYNQAETKVHPVVSKLFKIDVIEKFQFEPNIVPMLVSPIPWISQNMGGLLLGSYSLIRSANDMYHHDALKNVKETQYTAVLDSLNTLSACAWKINTSILDLQIQLFRSNGDSNLKISPPASLGPPLPTLKADMSPQEKGAVIRERVQHQQQRRDMHGLWCSDLYRLSIANKFRDETFWFPHSLDFRGRTYPLPPHFNHLGSDSVRGMLLFSRGKPLGPKGHDWLKIHLVNLTGLKKRNSNAERLAFADSIMEDIIDSADRPLTGRKWWQTSDEPWQTLACCFELAKIDRFEGNKEDYVCHFPVHQDGSCNGLQHYAALGRDQTGSESVNLVPFDVPQDVYSDVVELVEKERKKDADEGHELAIALDGFIKRKVIKQTIMTTVYGVTPFGAKAQIHKQLKDIPDFPQELAWKASYYLTDKTLSSLQEMFSATKNIQDWLTEMAQMISAFRVVDWTTPLGFPVVQPYYKRCTDTKLKQYTTKPNVVKQRNAFPPNYIHSLDSTHMMLTALYSMHAGITFVSVHDCFWTHACDVPIMNKICREQFVNMHSQPLLEDLSQHLTELVDRACNDPSLTEEMKKANPTMLKCLLHDVPKRGTFDLKDVLDSTYFFS